MKFLKFQENDGNVEIRCDNMDLCGDIVQVKILEILDFFLEYEWSK